MNLQGLQAAVSLLQADHLVAPKGRLVKAHGDIRAQILAPERGASLPEAGASKAGACISSEAALKAGACAAPEAALAAVGAMG